MSDMCNSRDNCSNFQFAATSVDAGARIYARKVDAVHENTLRVLRDISDTGKKSKKNNNAENSDDDLNVSNEMETGEDASKTFKKPKKTGKKSKHVFSEEFEEKMLAKTRRALVDPKLKYQHILHKMTNTNIGELSKMNVATELSVNDSGVPEELSELFEEVVDLANPSLQDPDMYRVVFF